MSVEEKSGAVQGIEKCIAFFVLNKSNLVSGYEVIYQAIQFRYN